MDVSFCIIYRTEELYFLPECLASLPQGCEIILLENKEGEEFFEVLSDEYVYEGNRVIKAFMSWKELNFSVLKNKCKSLATRGWIVNFDADDRLHYIESEWLYLNNLSEKIGGIIVNVINQHPKGMSLPIGEVVCTQQVRIFRNKPEILFTDRVHENIIPSIVASGYEIYVSTIDFKHIGYYTKDKEIILNKYLRNVNLLIMDLNERFDFRQLALLRENLNDLNEIGYIKHSKEY